MANALLQLPEGYRFVPTDEELIKDYLMKKVDEQPIPFNPIPVVLLYSKNPQDLAASYTASDDKWYFFTQRYRKYKSGDRASREAGDGTWKSVNKDIPILDDNRQLVGYKKSLAFHVGKKKTVWLMHEYTLPPPKLNDWVLCKIYKSNRKTNDKPMSVVRSSTNEEEAHETPQLDDNMIVPSTTVNQCSYYSMENLPSMGLKHSSGSMGYSLFNHGEDTYMHQPTATTTTLDPIFTLASFDSHDNYVSMWANEQVTKTKDTAFASVGNTIMPQTTTLSSEHQSDECNNNSMRPRLPQQQEDQENCQGHVNQDDIGNEFDIGQSLNIPYIPDQASLSDEVLAHTGSAMSFNPIKMLNWECMHPLGFPYNSPSRMVAQTTTLSRENLSDYDSSDDHNNNSKRPRLQKEVEENRPSDDSSDERNNSKQPRLQKDEENRQGHVNQDIADDNDYYDFSEYLNEHLTNEASDDSSDELNKSKRPSEEGNNSKQT